MGSRFRDDAEAELQHHPHRRPTTANLVYHLGGLEGPVSTPRYGLDIGRVGGTMSIMGLSYYTVEHKYDVGTGALSAYKLSRLRSASQDEKRRMLVLESGAGPNMAMATRDQHLVNFHQLLAHNVKGILLWNYRSRLSGETGILYLFINHSREERRFHVELRDAQTSWSELSTDDAVNLADELVLPPQGVLAIKRIADPCAKSLREDA